MDQTVLEEMVIRITGDISELKKKLEEATQVTKDAARNTEAEVAKIGFAMNAAAAPVKYWAATASTAFGMVKQWVGPTGALTTGFATTGEAMGGLGSIAATIPGPWGAAVSSVLSLGGQVIDWFEGKLRKNQEAAKQGFLDIASGASTFAKAVDQINVGRMREGVEKITDIIQRTEGGGLAGLNNLIGGIFGQGQEARIQREIGSVGRDVVTREQMMRRLMNDPQLRQLRTDMVSRQIGMETRERGETLGERMMTRRMMRAMHGEDPEAGEAEANTLQRRLAVTRLIRQTRNDAGRDTLNQQQAELQLSVPLEQAAQRTANFMRQMRADKAVEDMRKLSDETKKAAENVQLQSYGFGLTARESERYKIQVQLAQVENKLLLAGTSALDEGQRSLLEKKRQALAVDLETMRLFDRRLMVQESLQQMQTSRTDAEAAIGFMRQQQTILETNYALVVDTSREEANLARLRENLAAESDRVAGERARIESSRSSTTARFEATRRGREEAEGLLTGARETLRVEALRPSMTAGSLRPEFVAAGERVISLERRLATATAEEAAAREAMSRLPVTPPADRTARLSAEIEGAERLLAAERELREARERATMSLAATRAVQSPQERYDQEIDRLMTLRDVLDGTGISYETFTRSVAAAGEALRGADPYFQALNRQVQEGTGIASRFSDPAERLESQVNAVRTAYQQGAVTAEEFQDSIRGLREEFERTNRAMGGGTFTAAGSLEGIMRLENFTDRMRARREELLPTQINRTPGGIVSEAEESAGYRGGAFGGVLGAGPFSVGAPVPSFRGSRGAEGEATRLLSSIDARIAELVSRTPALPAGAEATLSLGFASIGL